MKIDKEELSNESYFTVGDRIIEVGAPIAFHQYYRWHVRLWRKLLIFLRIKSKPRNYVITEVDHETKTITIGTI